MAKQGLRARGTDTDVEYFTDVDEAVRFLTRHRVDVPDSYRGIYLVSRGSTVIEYKPEGFHDAELREIHDRVTGRRANPSEYRVGDQVMRKHRGLTREQALLVIAEVDVQSYDNRDRPRPGVRAWNVLLDDPDDRPAVFLLEEIRPAKPNEKSPEAKKFLRQNPGRFVNRPPRERNPIKGWRIVKTDKTRSGTPRWHVEWEGGSGAFSPQTGGWMSEEAEDSAPREITLELRQKAGFTSAGVLRNPSRFVNRPPRDNPDLHAALEKAAKSTAMTGRQPSGPRDVLGWIAEYPQTWRRMVARFER